MAADITVGVWCVSVPTCLYILPLFVLPRPIGVHLREPISLAYLALPSPSLLSSTYLSTPIMSLLLTGILRPIQSWPPFQSAPLAGSQSETEAEVQDPATCVDECWYGRPMHWEEA